MNTVFLLTGGNLGNRKYNLDKAKSYIGEYCGTVNALSSIYRTAAWGIEDQPEFYNQVLEVYTNLQPLLFMHKILAIEEEMGRKRDMKMGPRNIDIDILLWNKDVINLENLQVPHPHLAERRFALTPLAEINRNLVHPVYGVTIQALLDKCIDPLAVHKIDED